MPASSRRFVQAGDATPCGARTCPYCAARAPADEFLTDDVKRHLDGVARRLEAEVRAHRTAIPEAWAKENPRALRPPPPAGSSRRAPRREQPDDLLPIALPCCGDEQKVSDAWLGPIRCHRCGIAHLRAGPRDIGLEMALLRQWTSGES